MFLFTVIDSSYLELSHNSIITGVSSVLSSPPTHTCFTRLCNDSSDHNIVHFTDLYSNNTENLLCLRWAELWEMLLEGKWSVWAAAAGVSRPDSALPLPSQDLAALTLLLDLGCLPTDTWDDNHDESEFLHYIKKTTTTTKQKHLQHFFELYAVLSDCFVNKSRLQTFFTLIIRASSACC